MPLRVGSLWTYPIKSCRGIEVASAVVDARGFSGDRAFMLVDEGGVFISQRERPGLALVQPVMYDDCLLVHAPGMPALTVRPRHNGPARRVVVWRDTCEAVDQGDEAAAWFGEVLGAPARLVAMADAHVRRVDPAYARAADDQTGFADGYPFLLTSEASLADLNSRLAAPVPMNRFRPNIVATGCDVFGEDAWTHIRVGGVEFYAVKPCARCTITTTDQETGERFAEPLRTLATYRSRHGKIMFGQNLVHQGSGPVRVGDEIVVLATR